MYTTTWEAEEGRRIIRTKFTEQLQNTVHSYNILNIFKCFDKSFKALTVQYTVKIVYMVTL